MNKHEINVLSNNVLIEVNLEEEETSSGLVIASKKDTADVKTGIVKKAGKGRYENGEFIESEIKDGDKVMFQYGIDVDIDGKTYLIAKGSDILIILENDEEDN